MSNDLSLQRRLKASAQNPELRRAAIALNRNELAQAEKLLKTYLYQSPTDVAAIHMLAQVAARLGRDEDALTLLERCLELAPDFASARYAYAMMLNRRNEPSRALAEAERLLAAEPRNPGYRNLAAAILSRLGEFERSSRMYADLVKEYPGNSKVWLSYGHVLKTEGRLDESIAAYRRSIAREPGFGEAYWSLANLKTFRFGAADLDAMRAAAVDTRTDDENRWHLHFALGKAFEDAGEYAASFDHYAKGNALHRARFPYDADLNTRRIDRLKATFTREFFASRAGGGWPDPAPIFIVGMPRAGSTLLEQILSSHSEVEGTTELPEITTMARDLRGLAESEDIGAYADVLTSMAPDAVRQLGERYVQRTLVHRKTDRPYFIDKMPNNFLHVGMIHLVLPNAKIIDARRHPMACCFSNFKQHYARGQRFTYDLADVGRFYRDYVALMAHFDAVLPDRFHRVLYEQIVEDIETEVRRLLDYCGLPFEAECLRFFENERPVRTASSEQVRQPIYREGVDHWRHYESWLDPLKSALGPVLSAYPEVPAA
jgi:tetratricopeptide (TPR) repeat protein